jgi:hypothetical protein
MIFMSIPRKDTKGGEAHEDGKVVDSNPNRDEGQAGCVAVPRLHSQRVYPSVVGTGT